jgi:RNA polymerase primary sigma factor
MKSPVATLTREGEIYLARKIARGDEEARAELMEANLPVVLSIARRYKNRGVDMDDLIQEGQLGLHRATKSFDPSLGFRFATHAQWWIRQRISRMVRNTRNSIRVSTHAQEKYAGVIRKQAELAAELGRDPDDQELAEALGIDQEQLGAILQLAVTVHSFSLDETRQDGETTVRDRLQDPEQEQPSAGLERHAQQRFVDEVLSKLTPREEKVLRMRYGIGGHPDLELGQLEPLDAQAADFIAWVEQRSLERLQQGLQ